MQVTAKARWAAAAMVSGAERGPEARSDVPHAEPIELLQREGRPDVVEGGMLAGKRAVLRQWLAGARLAVKRWKKRYPSGRHVGDLVVELGPLGGRLRPPPLCRRRQTGWSPGP